MKRSRLPADPIAFLETLIAMPTVSPVRPEKDLIFPLLQDILDELGFKTQMLPFEQKGVQPVQNLHATLRGFDGKEASLEASFCYMGHLDVVPAGVSSAWSSPPFTLRRAGGELVGRGVADMKGSIVAFICALFQCLETRSFKRGRLDLLLTGDEEADAINGTAKMLKHVEQSLGLCRTFLIGEPSSNEVLGDQVRTGRRGSFNAIVHLRGKQGHVAYPDRVCNPLYALEGVLSMCGPLDKGHDFFPPSYLSCTYVDVGQKGLFNVTPEKVSAFINVRYNALWKGEDLLKHIKKVLTKKSVKGLEVVVEKIADWGPFVSGKGFLCKTVMEVIEEQTGLRPQIFNGGGTSDMRFLPPGTEVIECGLVGKTIHQKNERIKEKDFFQLIAIYRALLEKLFV